jgi:predicted nuclease of predicted toxin-antitoxin system
MRLLADEHIPPAFVSALRGEGHDITVVGETIALGSADTVMLEHTRETGRALLTEDTDFLGADPELDIQDHSGILACDTAATPGAVATAVRRIETATTDLTGTVLFVPGNWV